jgi:hypothetical protein
MIEAIFIPGTRFNLTLSEEEKKNPFPLMKQTKKCFDLAQILGDLHV